MNPEKLGPRPDEISCVFEISKAIHSTLDLRKSLYQVLDLMSRYLGMNRGSIALLDPESSEIYIEVAHGTSSRASRQCNTLQQPAGRQAVS